MKILNHIYFLFGLVLLSTMMSCVTAGKYKALENSLLASETELINRRRQVNQLNQDTLEYGQRYRICLEQKLELENYNQYSSSQLYKQLNKLQAELDNREAKIGDQSAYIKEKEAELKKKSEILEERSTKLNTILKVLDEQNKQILDLRFKIAEAVSGFDEEQIITQVKDNKVHVLIPEDLIFSASRTRIKQEGERGLLTFANTFSGRPDILVDVQGHADDQKTGSKDSWDQSVLRATNVVRTLIKGGLSPNQVTPSGKGAFSPRGDNNTSEGQAQNRRIELILYPDMKKLYELLKMD